MGFWWGLICGFLLFMPFLLVMYAERNRIKDFARKHGVRFEGDPNVEGGFLCPKCSARIYIEMGD